MLGRGKEAAKRPPPLAFAEGARDVRESFVAALAADYFADFIAAVAIV